MIITRHLRIVDRLKFFSVLLLILSCSYQALCQEVNNGLIDLRNNENFNDNIIDISGNWQFVYGKHLDANQMNSIATNEKQYKTKNGFQKFSSCSSRRC